MRVLMVEPEKTAYETEIGNDLKSMQAAVEGHIEVVYPYEELVAVVCNEEGKIEGLALNRALRDESGQIYDIVAGKFFICGLGEDNFTSLSPELMEQFKEKLRDPEIFMRFNGQIVSKKVSEQYIEAQKRLKERNSHER